jgi:predicted thioesterase
VGEGGTEDPLEDGWVDKGWLGHSGIVPGVSRRPSGALPRSEHISPGVSARVTLVVGPPDTAESLRSGDVPVLGTPRLIALCEEASCLAIAEQLLPGRTTVASRVQFDHLAPAGVGDRVVAEATLVRVEGRRLLFRLSAMLRNDEHTGLVGAGRLTRVLVERDAFMAKVGRGPSR